VGGKGVPNGLEGRLRGKGVGKGAAGRLNAGILGRRKLAGRWKRSLEISGRWRPLPSPLVRPRELARGILARISSGEPGEYCIGENCIGEGIGERGARCVVMGGCWTS
jgi:hypothetical protein